MSPLAAPRRDPDTRPRDLILVGHPNVGKSVIFSLLTGRYVNVSNYPGTTVEISSGSAVLQGTPYRVCDTPGIHSLLPLSQDERVTRDILLEGGDRVVVQVIDAKNLTLGLQLTLQLLEMEVPLVICLNMRDEAEERGIRIDAGRLEAKLGVPVVSMVAVRRRGFGSLVSALKRAAPGAYRVDFGPRLEAAVARVRGWLDGDFPGRRALALMIVGGDDTLREWLRGRVRAEDLEEASDLTRELQKSSPEPIAYLMNRRRLADAGRLAREVQATGARGSRGWSNRLDPWILHPVAGMPILAGVLYLLYLFVGRFGAGTCVDWLEQGLFGNWVNPLAIHAVRNYLPVEFLQDLLVGPYGLITMGLTYAIAIVLPIVGTFFIAFGILEDSGYFPRLAVMLNRVFRAMGLNGKAVLPMVLGLGCDTMATLATRVLETWRERAIVITLLALGVPCSAQLAVIFALLGALSARALLIWLAVVVGMLFLVGTLAARVLPGRGSDFILELPPLRLPRPGNLVTKTVGRVEWYLREAVPLFLLGTLILFLFDQLGWLAIVDAWASPVVVRLLGLPGAATEAFLIGFLRRDFGAAGLFLLQEQGRLDPIQTLVSVVTMTLFIPCVAHFFMIVKEKNLRFALGVAGFVVALALAVGSGLNLVLRSLEVSL